MNGAGEVSSSLGGVCRAPVGKSSVLGVVENEVLDGKGGGQAAGIKRSAVVFLVGFEFLRIGIKAESGSMYWGAGTNTDIISAGVDALLSAFNNMKEGEKN